MQSNVETNPTTSHCIVCCNPAPFLCDACAASFNALPTKDHFDVIKWAAERARDARRGQ